MAFLTALRTPKKPAMRRPNSETADAFWMRKALQIARKGRFAVSPNPMVGACLTKSNRLISMGYHAYYGGDHAEVMAIKNAGTRAKGSTLYVSLEPCSTWGKTPPCVASVLDSGIKRVVIASLDPNPRHKGKGIAVLRKAGIKVTAGILSKEAEKLNEAFFKHCKTGLPWVSLKMAQSLDGKIATKTGKSRWITSSASRQFVHRLRAEQDAVLVGKNTLLADNPRLSSRMRILRKDPQKPWRIALCPDLNISSRARIFEGEELTFLAVSEKRIKKNQAGKKMKAAFIPLPENKNGLNLQSLLKKLGSMGVAKLLVEGGGELAWSFLSQKLVDRFYWFVAPKFIGGREAKTSVEGDGVALPDQALNMKVFSIKKSGDDLLLEGSPC